jgi:hypothetical protein
LLVVERELLPALVYHGFPDDESDSDACADTELTDLGVDPALICKVARPLRCPDFLAKGCCTAGGSKTPERLMK